MSTRAAARRFKQLLRLTGMHAHGVCSSAGAACCGHRAPSTGNRATKAAVITPLCSNACLCVSVNATLVVLLWCFVGAPFVLATWLSVR
jgi:hypothetical protein